MTGIANWLPSVDLGGNPRINGGIIDLGAYEACATPAQPSAISGNANPCQGSSQVYSVTNVTGISYTWTVPNTWTITAGQGSYSITVTIGSSSGNISVTPSNSCGDGNPRTLAVTVNTTPANAGTINGPDQVCKGSDGIVYTVPVIANASNYNWSVPSGVTIVSGGNTNSITVNFSQSAVSENVSVYGSNSCGDGQSSNLFVTVNYVTADAGVDQTIPYGTATILSGNASNGSGNYSWSWQPASLLVNANVQNPTTTNLTATNVFTLTVTDISTGCISSDEMMVSISGGPLAVVASADPSTICEGQSSQLNAIASGGSGNYSWSWTSNPTGFTSNLQNPTVSPSVTTTYMVVVNDGYNTTSDNVMLKVNTVPLAAGKPMGDEDVDLHYSSESQYTTLPVANTDYYNWILEPANMGTISGNGTSISITWSGILGTASLSVQAVNACGDGQSSQQLVIDVDNSVGVDNPIITKVEVYPNPTEGVFNIKISDNFITGKASVTIYSLQDEKVMETMLETGVLHTLALPFPTPGIYAVVVQTGLKNYVVKVIKK